MFFQLEDHYLMNLSDVRWARIVRVDGTDDHALEVKTRSQQPFEGGLGGQRTLAYYAKVEGPLEWKSGHLRKTLEAMSKASPNLVMIDDNLVNTLDIALMTIVDVTETGRKALKIQFLTHPDDPAYVASRHEKGEKPADLHDIMRMVSRLAS